MTELPHITAYIRRLRRLSARPTLFITGGWLALVLTVMAVPQLLEGFIGCMISLSIILCGKFAIYWVIAETMAGLSREGKRAAPAWYMTPLPNAMAVAGILASAMLAIVPPLAGLISFLPLHAQIWLDWYHMIGPGLLQQHGCDARMLSAATWQFVLHLPLFALFAGCLQLALRRLAFSSIIPVILATVASLAGMWEAAMFREPPIGGIYEIEWIWSIIIILLGTLLFIVLLFLMKWCAESEKVSTLYGVLLLWTIALPALIGLTATGALIDCISIGQSGYRAQYFNFIYSGIFMPLHAHYAMYQPDMPSVIESLKIRYQLCLYSWPLNNLLAVVTYAVMLATSFVLLWQASLRCLEVVRNPAKRLDQRRSRTARLSTP